MSMPHIRPRRFRSVHMACDRGAGLAALLFTALTLSGCASLPSNGPTASAITRGAMDASSVPYQVEEIVSPNSSIFAAPPKGPEPSLLASVGQGQVLRDAIWPGDVLQVRIYEIGISLFSGPPSNSTIGSSNDLTAHNEVFEVVVDEQGMISLPYLNQVPVAGRTLRQTELQLRSAMRGRSQSADVMVKRIESPATNFAVAGNVRRPGLFALGPSSRNLLDGITMAGGQADAPHDDVIRFTRNSITRLVRLSEIDPADAGYNLPLAPGDRIEVLHQPLTFLSLGAAGRVAQIPFDAERITLAEAIAKMGGPNDNQANPRAVFIFRNNSGADAESPLVVYRLNMIRPSSYILAQKIYMKDKDLIYIANADANIPTKMVTIINQLFSPVVTLRALSQ